MGLRISEQRQHQTPRQTYMLQETSQDQVVTSSFRKIINNVEAVNLRLESDRQILRMQHQLPDENYGNSEQDLAVPAQSRHFAFGEIMYISNSLINFNHNLGNIRYNHHSMKGRRFTYPQT